MKTDCFAGVFTSLFSLCVVCSHAQNSAFTYQGQLTDNGSPANGILQDFGGNVGIGTTAPGEKLLRSPRKSRRIRDPCMGAKT